MKGKKNKPPRQLNPPVKNGSGARSRLVHCFEPPRRHSEFRCGLTILLMPNSVGRKTWNLGILPGSPQVIPSSREVYSQVRCTITLHVLCLGRWQHASLPNAAHALSTNRPRAQSPPVRWDCTLGPQLADRVRCFAAGGGSIK